MIRLITAILLASTSYLSYTQETPRFGVSVDRVYVDVLVTQKGIALEGLTKVDFVLSDNGVPQDIEVVDAESEGIPLSCVMVLDTSLSVRGHVLDHLKLASQAFLGGLENNDEAGLLTFSHRVQLLGPLESGRASLQAIIGQVTAGGGTALYDAVYSGVKLTEAAKGRPVVFLFTDGADTYSWLSQKKAMDVVKFSDAVVYVVGIEPKGRVISTMQTDSGYAYFLKQITDTSGGQVYYANTAADLRDVYLRALSKLKSRYLLAYEPRGVTTEGWHDLVVRVVDIDADVRARRGYFRNP